MIRRAEAVLQAEMRIREFHEVVVDVVAHPDWMMNTSSSRTDLGYFDIDLAVWRTF